MSLFHHGLFIFNRIMAISCFNVLVISLFSGRKANKKHDPMMVGDYGVEEWKENGKLKPVWLSPLLQ